MVMSASSGPQRSDQLNIITGEMMGGLEEGGGTGGGVEMLVVISNDWSWTPRGERAPRRNHRPIFRCDSLRLRSTGAKQAGVRGHTRAPEPPE